MFKKIVEFFTGKKTESNFAHPLDAVTTPNVPQAPYKVPEPVATTPILVVEQPTTVEKVVAEPAQPEKKPAVKKPAAMKPAVKKPVVKKPAVPRKSRTPKQ
jgi:hypothetical protein